MATKMYEPGPLNKTRFPELGFRKRGDHWRILDLTGDYSLAMHGDYPGIGPQYPTRRALLDDLERYAESNGYT